MPRFESKGADLYIDGLRVKRAWESNNGFYWFAIEKAGLENIAFHGKNLSGDAIWYGLFQGYKDKWTCFSQAELEDLEALKIVKEIKKKDLKYAGRR